SPDPRLDRGAELAVDAVHVAPDRLELGVVVGLEGFVPLRLELFQLRLEPGLLAGGGARRVVMDVGVDPEGLADGREQVLLVHLRVALDRVVLDALGDLAELVDRLLLQLFVGECHSRSSRGCRRGRGILHRATCGTIAACPSGSPEVSSAATTASSAASGETATGSTDGTTTSSGACPPGAIAGCSRRSASKASSPA